MISSVQIRCKADERSLMERAAQADDRSLSQWVVRAAVKATHDQLGGGSGAGGKRMSGSPVAAARMGQLYAGPKAIPRRGSEAHNRRSALFLDNPVGSIRKPPV